MAIDQQVYKDLAAALADVNVVYGHGRQRPDIEEIEHPLIVISRESVQYTTNTMCGTGDDAEVTIAINVHEKGIQKARILMDRIVAAMAASPNALRLSTVYDDYEPDVGVWTITSLWEGFGSMTVSP